jgi:DNA-binding beta-propeller fold protein YncE
MLPQSFLPSRSHHSGSTYPVKKGLLFVANADPEAPYEGVRVYDARMNNPKPIVNITDDVSTPNDACIDSQRTLYVVNGDGWISEYKLGDTSPFAIITQGIDEPAFCAIDADDNLWVSNIAGVNVTEYLHGDTVPAKVITNGIAYPVGIAIDYRGNLYVANRQSGATNVQVYARGQSSPSRTITKGVNWPIGIGVDKSNTLYVPNAIPGNIEEYHYGDIKPFAKITAEMNGPDAITFAPSGWVYATNLGLQGGGSGPPETILEFRPGAQVPSKRTISNGLDQAQGTAFYPPQLP